MGRYKKIGILLAFLVVISAVAFGISWYEEEKEIIKNSDEIILEIDSGNVSTLSWEYESGLLSFHKDGEWVYDEDEAFPVDEEKMEDLLSVFQEFGVSFVIEEVEDYGQYGLDAPVCTIRFTAEDTSYEVLLGAFSTMDSERYVAVRETSGGDVSAGNGKVYLVKTDPLDYFDAELSDLIDHDDKLSYDGIVDIVTAGAENRNIVYEEESSRTYCADDVYFLKDGETYLPLDSSRVDDYLKTIRNLKLTDYVTYNVTAEELESYGLDQPELTITVNYLSDGEEGAAQGTYTLSVSRSPGDKEKTEDSGEVSEDFDAYVRIGDSQIIYRIASGDYEDLMAVSYDSLRHSDVFSADTTSIRQIDVTLEGTDYTITSDDEDGSRTYYYQENEVEMASLKSHLKSLDAVRFTEEQPEQKEEIHLVIHLDNENFPEIEIGLYRYDGDECLAVVDGEPVSFVQRSDVVDLIEAVHGIVLNE
ncbi:MAG: DUF4340 domain-containing protein [Lachnospiraceae bacterium]|nr:DUF4340 domain-containing protein [Muribaculaceae bacterium]MCM1411885.1 DUF4340 domain-containing protein [Lachnospiraceae bacterium]